MDRFLIATLTGCFLVSCGCFLIYTEHYGWAWIPFVLCFTCKGKE